MPFTFAHPVIILPLRKNLSFSGLIIGSIVPDFEYFFRLRVVSQHSHTLAGLFYFDLPLGVILYVVFVKMVRIPLLKNLPNFIRERFSSSFSSFGFIGILTSVFIGAASHLVWDGFTHATGYFVNLNCILQYSVSIAGFPLPIFKVLQYLSTAFGLITLVMAVSYLPRKNKHFLLPDHRYWPIVLAVLLLTFGIKYLTTGVGSLGDIVVTTISGVLWGILISSVHHHFKSQKTKTPFDIRG